MDSIFIISKKFKKLFKIQKFQKISKNFISFFSLNRKECPSDLQWLFNCIQLLLPKSIKLITFGVSTWKLKKPSALRSTSGNFLFSVFSVFSEFFVFTLFRKRFENFFSNFRLNLKNYSYLLVFISILCRRLVLLWS